jgi:oligopeptide/dipeptide ABC transporter ATP-binding protein
VSLLEVRDLDILFRSAANPVTVVSGLDFRIEESEVFGLAGESGCGKSITALSIMGLLPPNAFAKGEIFFRGRDLLKLDPESMRRLRGKDIAMVFQEPMTSLNPVLTVGYQIEEVLVTHMSMSGKEARDKAVELLRSVKIPSPETRVHEYPHQMSGGLRQRVMIAMAIACSPSLLIADEPTTALDVTIQAQILELIEGLREERRMAILLITHDLAVLAENAARVAVMYAGRIMEIADTGELFHNPKHPYTLGLLASIPQAKGKPLNPISGAVPRPEDLPGGCVYSGRCSYSQGACTEREPEFVEVSAGHFVRCRRTGEIKWNF